MYHKHIFILPFISVSQLYSPKRMGPISAYSDLAVINILVAGCGQSRQTVVFSALFSEPFHLQQSATLTSILALLGAWEILALGRYGPAYDCLMLPSCRVEGHVLSNTDILKCVLIMSI